MSGCLCGPLILLYCYLYCSRILYMTDHTRAQRVLHMNSNLPCCIDWYEEWRGEGVKGDAGDEKTWWANVVQRGKCCRSRRGRWRLRGKEPGDKKERLSGFRRKSKPRLLPHPGLLLPSYSP